MAANFGVGAELAANGGDFRFWSELGLFLVFLAEKTLVGSSTRRFLCSGGVGTR